MHTHTNTHAHTVSHTCICTHAHTYTHVHVCTQTHILTSTHLQTQTHAHTCSYVPMHMRTHVLRHTPSCKNTQEHTYANIPRTHVSSGALPYPSLPLNTTCSYRRQTPGTERGGTHLEVPVDDPHLVAVENRLQDLLDAVTAANSRRISADGP